MRDYLSHEVRNVAVLGHSGAGKTAVMESLLLYTKATDRFGKTSEGSSVIDFDPEEIKRGTSIYTSIIPIEWDDCKINFIDTPGYLDYVGEKQAGFDVGDSVLIVASAKNVLESGTKLAYKAAVHAKKPAIFFINMNLIPILKMPIVHYVKNLVKTSFHLNCQSLKMARLLVQ